eukprot:108747-Chlamydomonas_euryale.AAC.2
MPNLLSNLDPRSAGSSTQQKPTSSPDGALASIAVHRQHQRARAERTLSGRTTGACTAGARTAGARTAGIRTANVRAASTSGASARAQRLCPHVGRRKAGRTQPAQQA